MINEINLNADMGEGFGAYDIGDDESLLQIIRSANVACGLHAGDPTVMHRLVSRARDEGVSIGAHPGFNDLWGFGRRRIDMNLAKKRIETINTPILVMGREEDHLQGIFRTTYELLAEAGKQVEWVSFDHGMHGYIFPEREGDDDYQVDDVQREAIAGVIAYLDRYLKK